MSQSVDAQLDNLAFVLNSNAKKKNRVRIFETRWSKSSSTFDNRSFIRTLLHKTTVTYDPSSKLTSQITLVLATFNSTLNIIPPAAESTYSSVTARIKTSEFRRKVLPCH